MAFIIHWDVCRHFGVPVESRWYRHHPDRLVETDDVTMMWDTTIPTARKIKANRPDIVSEIGRQTLVFLLISAVLLMATLARNMLRSWRSTATYEWRQATCGIVEHWWFRWSWELWAQCTQVLHGGWTLFQVITTCSTYRKQCFWDLLGSFVKSCLLSRQP